MKKSTRTLLFIALATPLLVQCASQTDVEDLRYQLRIVNKKLEDMKSNQVGQLQKRQAAATGQMDQFENEILQVKSQLEETYHLNQRLKEQNKELENSISSVAQEEAAKREEALSRLEDQQLEKEAVIADLNEKLKLQQVSVQAIQQARIKDAEIRAKDAAIAVELAKTKNRAASLSLQSGKSIKQIRQTKQKIKRSVVAPITQQATSTVKPKVKSNTIAVQTTATNSTTDKPITVPQTTSDFTKAQQLFSRNKFKEALKLFEQDANNSSSKSAVEARYMMGECLFNLKEYDKAIMQYQKIISQYASDSKAPSAMLKQGMAFERLADKDTAKVIYKKLLKKHGSSTEAATAQDRLEKL